MNLDNKKSTKCLHVINTLSGNAVKLAEKKDVQSKLLERYATVDDMYITESQDNTMLAEKMANYDAICISGGDGTLNSVLNAVKDFDIEILCNPCGTVNDFARTLKRVERKSKKLKKGMDTIDTDTGFNRIDVGKFNDKIFSYVAAIGTFSAIGHRAKVQAKKRIKKLAYWVYAFKEFRSQKIKAMINIDGRIIEDTFTLIMAIKSENVFGFKFNKLYKPSNGKGHLLLIKTPIGALRNIKLFFRFFRSFFIGFKKEKDSKNIKFLEFEKLKISFDEPQDFGIDGELIAGQNSNEIEILKEKIRIKII